MGFGWSMNFRPTVFFSYLTFTSYALNSLLSFKLLKFILRYCSVLLNTHKIWIFLYRLSTGKTLKVLKYSHVEPRRQLFVLNWNEYYESYLRQIKYIKPEFVKVYISHNVQYNSKNTTRQIKYNIYNGIAVRNSHSFVFVCRYRHHAWW